MNEPRKFQYSDSKDNNNNNIMSLNETFGDSKDYDKFIKFFFIFKSLFYIDYYFKLLRLSENIRG